MFELTFLSHPQQRDSGDYLHRVLWPGKALGEHLSVLSIQSSHPDYLEIVLNTDVLVIKMVVDQDLLPLIRKRSSRGLITVYEISDDFESFPESLPSHAFYARKDIQELIRTLASTTTAVQFSSTFLYAKYHHLNRNSAVFLNQCSRIPPLRKLPKRELTIGWAGSTGHRADIERLAEILSQWRRVHDLKFMIMADQTIVDIFSHYDIKVKAKAPGSMERYLSFLKQIDIGIAMINEDEFSMGRSDGKFLEYASQGVVAVCQNRGSYAGTVRDGETGFLFDDGDSFLTVLDRLVEDRELRARVRQNAHNYLRKYRTHRHGALERLEFYKGLFPSGQPSSERAVGKPRFLEMIHPIEKLLLDAMLLHRDQQFELALNIYMKLLDVAPDFHVIWMRLRDLYQCTGNRAEVQRCNAEIERLLARYY